MSHRLVAWHDDYDAKPVAGQDRAVPDAVVDFAAWRVVDVRVEVRTPEGSLADNAWLSWRGPLGSGGGAWTPELHTLRLPAGSTRVKAQTTMPRPTAA